MSKAKIFGWLLALALFAVTAIQFIPSIPVIIPALIPEESRQEHRVLGFEGIANFRDLGGYQTTDGRTTQWGKLYRSGHFAKASRSDLNALTQLELSTLIDFRSGVEKEEEPNALPEPPGFDIIEIPTLDDGNQAIIGELMERVESGDFEDFDPNFFMMEANRQFASVFTPQFSQFMQAIVEADGKPVVWHCSAGKDRTGFAAAILLRILGVPQETIMADYMESKTHALDARTRELLLIRIFAGAEGAEKMKIMMGVERAWLEAAFDTIDQQWGSFDAYVEQGLQLTAQDIEHLKNTLLL